MAVAARDLAAVYYSWGRYADAEPLFQRAVAIRSKAFGPDGLQVADSLLRLANNSRAQKKYPDALKQYRRVLEFRRKALGPDHADVAHTLHDLGDVT